MKNDFCAACGSTKELHHHHLVPKSLGGSNEETNLITLCHECHAKVHEIAGWNNHNRLTKEALRKKKAEGQRTGSIPYGKRLGSDHQALIDDPVEGEVINLVRMLAMQGWRLREIGCELKRLGYQPRGREWHATTVLNLIKASGLVKTEVELSKEDFMWFRKKFPSDTGKRGIDWLAVFEAALRHP
jgi:hypothetical protein